MATAKIQSNAKPSSSIRKRGPPSEKRKLQNREAQRKYREKLKNRLENLERLAEQIPIETGSLLEEHDFEHQANRERGSLRNEKLHEIYYPEPQTSHTLEMSNTMNVIEPQVFGNLGVTQESIPSLSFGSPQDDLPLQIDESSFWIPGDSVLPLQEYPLLSGATLDFPSAEFEVDISEAIHYRQEQSTDFPASSDAYFTAPYVTGSQENSELSASPPNIELLPRSSPHTSSTSASMSSLELYKDRWKTKPRGINCTDKKKITHEIIQYLRLDDTKENQCLVSTAIARGHNIRDVFLAGLQGMGDKNPLKSNLPNPHKNTLTLVRTSTLQAYLSVAEAAGIHIPDLYLENTPSPFYKPNASPPDVQSLIPFHASRMPPDLRPTASQILYPHRPWLDLLPFPTLRERALTLTSMEPALINLSELKNDIFKNNGLFCWQNSDTKGSGHPWDRRSWEAEEWFLKKWWILIGREEADVVCQTRWWREMRGEGRLELGWGK